MIRALARALRRFARAEEGTSTVEFVLCLPVVMFVFMASFEGGIVMVRQVLLERSTDVVMRELRLGLIEPPPTGSTKTMHDILKDDICGQVTMMINCRGQIAIEIIAVDRNTWTLPSGNAPCVDRPKAVHPVTTLTIGQQNSIMLVRVCVIQDAFFPFVGIGKWIKISDTDKTGYRVITIGSFVNEPSASGSGSGSSSGSGT
ncbi:MAG TPA: TadE family protein [Rhodopila sp.]